MKRKIIQIAIGAGHEEAASIIALADDGSLWEGCRRFQGKDATPRYAFKWEELPALPDNNTNFQKVR